MKWKKSTFDRYWEALECLPPAKMTGHGFLLGEPHDHNAQGQPVFSAFIQIGEEYYESMGHLTIAEFKALQPGDVLKGVFA